jgi:hypothetical protein
MQLSENKSYILGLQFLVFISKSENDACKNLLAEDKQGTPLTTQGKYPRSLYFFIQGLKIPDCQFAA